MLRVLNDAAIKCPTCGLDVFYKYGKSKTGRQRFLCLLCGRQFAVGAKRLGIKDRPTCPECGKSMNLYKREDIALRFRCSDYPKCKTYRKAKRDIL
ncbi:hypothetical protein M1N52_02090 [Thermodesulfovibrionales bacterium]|nr:hypothetical protein [Thermodesulfovibrionales bacterium]